MLVRGGGRRCCRRDFNRQPQAMVDGGLRHLCQAVRMLAFKMSRKFPFDELCLSYSLNEETFSKPLNLKGNDTISLLRFNRSKYCQNDFFRVNFECKQRR
jgi:hypothetical protein